MKILIIVAHPSLDGFCHKIVNQYKSGALETGKEVEILDLYNDERQNFLRFENVREIKSDPQRDNYQAKISAADELVFVFPLWWMGMPAILKNFIDINFSVGFAYKYVKFPIIHGRPVGLLKGRGARVFVTCDGPKWSYKFLLTPFKINIKYFILTLCGFKVKTFFIMDRMRWRNKKKKNKWLKKVYEQAKK